MAELFAIKVLSRQLGRNFGNFLFEFSGTLFYAYGLNLSQIGS